MKGILAHQVRSRHQIEVVDIAVVRVVVAEANLHPSRYGAIMLLPYHLMLRSPPVDTFAHLDLKVPVYIHTLAADRAIVGWSITNLEPRTRRCRYALGRHPLVLRASLILGVMSGLKLIGSAAVVDIGHCLARLGRLPLSRLTQPHSSRDTINRPLWYAQCCCYCARGHLSVVIANIADLLDRVCMPCSFHFFTNCCFRYEPRGPIFCYGNYRRALAGW